MIDEGFEELPLRLVYQLLEQEGLSIEAAEMRRAILGKNVFREKAKRRQAKRGWAIEVLRSKGLWERFIAECWSNGATADGAKLISTYEDRYRELKRLENDVEELDEAEDVDEDTAAEQFEVLEKELQTFLARNLDKLEPGMTLWAFADGQSPVEYRADDTGRRVDILARDRDGTPVVIELKAKRGHEKVVGQILYYRECVKLNLAASRVRIMIVAREISAEVRIATRGLADVGLFEYKLAMTLNKL